VEDRTSIGCCFGVGAGAGVCGTGILKGDCRIGNETGCEANAVEDSAADGNGIEKSDSSIGPGLGYCCASDDTLRGSTVVDG